MRTAKFIEQSREFSARERLMFKDTSNATKLDEATANGAIEITPKDYAVLELHHDDEDIEDYTQVVIVTTDGEKYVTGSKSFYNAFKEIYDEMGNEEFSITVYQKESKNYKGKNFITCSIV